MGAPVSGLLNVGGSRRSRLMWFGAVAVAVAAIGVVVVSALADEGIGRSERMHPDGTVFDDPVRADRLTSASFVTDIAVAPGGEVFYLEHLTGRIGVLVADEAGRLADSTVVEVELPEAGRLFHLVLHPEWPSEPTLYFSAHEGTGRNQRLALFRVRVDDLVGGVPERLVGGLASEDPARGAEADHFGSALAICDGYLYLSVGDTDSPGPGSYRSGGIRFRAQDVEFAEGKVLRYQLDGTDLTPAGVLGERYPVFALGFRNVFAMDCDPETGWPVVADNGSAGFDQLRLVEPGSNHEWPDSDRRDAENPPLFDTEFAAIAPTGIVARADDSSEGGTELVFTGFHMEAVYSLPVDADGERVGNVRLLHPAGSAPLSLAGDGDGCIYLGTGDGVWLLREPRCPRELVAASEGGAERFAGDPAEVYRANCSACHGLEREGGGAPEIRGERLSESDEFYIQTILRGRATEGMPAWGAAGMSEDQARAMLDYLRSPVP